MNARLRSCLFWIHLVSGLITGAVIAVMSATGVAIAFEAEILDYLDRDVARVEVPADTPRLTIAEQQAALLAARPDFRVSGFNVFRDPTRATQFSAGREHTVYVNPYTGAVADPRSGPAHDFLHTLEDWHRWLGREGDSQSLGRLVTGVSNAAFLMLCFTGLILWWPHALRWPVLKRALWFVKTKSAKARDFNWHNVFGFWTLPVLIVLVGTGVVISFGWAHDLVFRLAGEKPPQYRDFRMMMVPQPTLPTPPANATPLPPDAIVAGLQERHPDWQAVLYSYPRPGADPAPLNLTVIDPAPFTTAGRVMKHVDPYTGADLSSTAFADRSAGLRARVWVRFLHTGEAFGLTGKIIATLATAASLLLVYTGFALSWRRFFGRKSARAAT